MLLHAADARAALAIRDLGNVHAADGDRSFSGPIQPQQQLEHGALARAGAPNERRLLAGLHREGEVGKHRPPAVAEGHVVNRHVAVRNSRASASCAARSGWARNALMRFTPAIAD